MNTKCSNQTRHRTRCLFVLIALALVALSTTSAHAATPQPSSHRTTELSNYRTSALSHSATITWHAAAGDARWSNPANWEGGIVPGPSDIARFAAGSADARVDAAYAGVVGGILLEPDYAGAVHLERDLAIAGDLTIAGGTFAGEDARLWIQGAARVSGGLLTTPRAPMRVDTLDIQTPGIVRLGANGKLDLAGDGTPLTGNGVLDTTTNRPNSIEYSGRTNALGRWL